MTTLLLALTLGFQNSALLEIHVDQPTVRVSPSLYGVFFEEINHAGDGGLYAELVRNRGFEDAETPIHWDPVGGSTMSVARHDDRKQVLKIAGASGTGMENLGYWGISVKALETYKLCYRANGGTTGAKLVATIIGGSGDTLCHTPVQLPQGDASGEVLLRPLRTDHRAKLRLSFTSKSSGVEFDMISLFPEKTWKNRKNGLRPDLASMLVGLRPAFLRFPGGCWVEGDTMATALRWKQTIGPMEKRRTQANLWNYQSTNGLGFHEYLQMCEDLKAEPLFVINCGMSHRDVVPMDQMDEFVQDALDAIEYANGPTTTKWGRQRALNGHPKPYNLVYLEIGNENGGPAYAERYPMFVRAIKSKYPEIRLIANVWGGVPTSAPVDIIDEHYYSTPEFFVRNSVKYDSYDRKGPKVYVGEYAVTQGGGSGNLKAALGEAAFMTGMERNSDVVVMSSYAPLFANVNDKAWNPDLIYFDNHRVCGTPSYYVQQLFSANRPDSIVRHNLTGVKKSLAKFPSGGIGVGTWSTQAEFKDIKVTQGSTTLFESSDGRQLSTESGDWNVIDGAYRQTQNIEGARTWAGDESWHSYTLTCRARRLSGSEGFLVTVGRKDDRNFLWWNIGGWGNTQSAIEHSKDGAKSPIGQPVRGSVETGRWYDIKVEYTPGRLVCSLDGKVMFDEAFPTETPLYVVSGKRDDGEVIIKVVNVSDSPQPVRIRIPNALMEGSLQTLTSLRPTDENTLDEPRKVVPKGTKIRFTNGTANHVFPPHSLTILRVRQDR